MTTLATDVRRVLASEGPLCIREIWARCPAALTTTAIAVMLTTDVAAGRALRTGERGAYRYALTASGREAADNPRILRSASHRRTHGRRIPIARVLTEAIADAAP